MLIMFATKGYFSSVDCPYFIVELNCIRPYCQYYHPDNAIKYNKDPRTMAVRVGIVPNAQFRRIIDECRTQSGDTNLYPKGYDYEQVSGEDSRNITYSRYSYEKCYDSGDEVMDNYRSLIDRKIIEPSETISDKWKRRDRSTVLSLTDVSSSVAEFVEKRRNVDSSLNPVEVAAKRIRTIPQFSPDPIVDPVEESLKFLECDDSSSRGLESHHLDLIVHGSGFSFSATPSTSYGESSKHYIDTSSDSQVPSKHFKGDYKRNSEDSKLKPNKKSNHSHNHTKQKSSESVKNSKSSNSHRDRSTNHHDSKHSYEGSHRESKSSSNHSHKDSNSKHSSSDRNSSSKNSKSSHKESNSTCSHKDSNSKHRSKSVSSDSSKSKSELSHSGSSKHSESSKSRSSKERSSSLTSKQDDLSKTRSIRSQSKESSSKESRKKSSKNSTTEKGDQKSRERSSIKKSRSREKSYSPESRTELKEESVVISDSSDGSDDQHQPGTQSSGDDKPAAKVRIAHVPNVTSLLNAKQRIKQVTPKKFSGSSQQSDAKKRPVVSVIADSCVPLNVRQSAVNNLYEELVKFLEPEKASEHSLSAEINILQKVQNVKSYKNHIALLVMKIRKSNGLLECK